MTSVVAINILDIFLRKNKVIIANWWSICGYAQSSTELIAQVYIIIILKMEKDNFNIVFVFSFWSGSNILLIK